MALAALGTVADVVPLVDENRVIVRFGLSRCKTTAITGLAALINTSFNTKGKPIINSAAECLEMLDTLADLDYVLIEELFNKNFTLGHVHRFRDGEEPNVKLA